LFSSKCRIHISDPQVDTDGMGSPGWFVKDIDLFTTTVVLGVTNEVATYSNGSLANFRIINGTRSHKAILGFFMKFPLDVPFAKIRIFSDAMERFVRARPREVRSVQAPYAVGVGWWPLVFLIPL
jgi:hypothetical protein